MNSEATAKGRSIEIPRLISGTPAESGFSTNASPPRRVIITLATRDITGMTASAMRNATAIPSVDCIETSSKLTNSMSAAILP